MSDAARAYESSAPGYQAGKAPRLSATDDYGTATAKFDGVDGVVMIDRKRAIVTTHRTRHEALRQSATAAENGYRVRWEVPNAAEARTAQRLFDELGIRNIDVSIVAE